MKRIIVMTFLLLCSCTQPQSGKMLDQPIGKTLTSSIGSEILTIHKQKDLPNAFGGADIFGRKVDAGATVLKFSGLNSNGHAVFTVLDHDVYSNETTMSRSGMSVTNASITSYGNDQMAMQGITTKAPSASHYVSGQSATEFTVNPKKVGGFDFGEYHVDIKAISGAAITYSILKL